MLAGGSRRGVLPPQWRPTSARRSVRPPPAGGRRGRQTVGSRTALVLLFWRLFLLLFLFFALLRFLVRFCSFLAAAVTILFLPSLRRYPHSAPPLPPARRLSLAMNQTAFRTRYVTKRGRGRGDAFYFYVFYFSFPFFFFAVPSPPPCVCLCVCVCVSVVSAVSGGAR